MAPFVRFLAEVDGCGRVRKWQSDEGFGGPQGETDFAALPLWATADRPSIRNHLSAALAGQAQRWSTTVCSTDGSCERVTLLFAPAPQGATILGLAPSFSDPVSSPPPVSDGLLQGVIDAAPVGIGLLDKDLRFLMVNPRLAAMNGFSPSDHVGRTPKELLPDIHDLDDLYALFDRILKNGEPHLGIEVTGSTPASGDEPRIWVEHFYPAQVEGEAKGLAIVVEDVTTQRQAEAQRELLINELHHRVKNILAMIQAMASQTMQNASSLADFKVAFGGRLQAISAAHDTVLSDQFQGQAILRDLILRIVEPYAGKAGDRLVVDGPRVQIETSSAHGLGLVLHELATNAAKYGALTRPEGQILVSWRLTLGTSPPVLTLTWEEVGGPPVSPPTHTGFGSRLIASALSHVAGAHTDLRFEPGGLCVEITLPLL